VLPAAGVAQSLPENPEPAKTGVSEWSRVGDLAREDEITVARAGRSSLHCRFAGATTDYLFCDESIPWLSERGFRLDHADVVSVRMDQNRRNAKIIIGAGAVAGGIWGVLRTSRSYDNGSSVFGGFAGAGIGALAGFIPAEAVKAFHLIPGPLIYRQSSPDRKTIFPSPSTSMPNAGQPFASTP
jgi:hypothetical protein